MNPFLILGEILSWLLFIIFGLLFFRGSTERGICFGAAFLSLMFGILLMVACAAEWNRLHGIH